MPQRSKLFIVSRILNNPDCRKVLILFSPALGAPLTLSKKPVCVFLITVLGVGAVGAPQSKL